MGEDTRGLQALAQEVAMPTQEGGGSCGHASLLGLCREAGASPNWREVSDTPDWREVSDTPCQLRPTVEGLTDEADGV